jgi:hypothetical protein
MAKIIVSIGEKIVRELTISRERITIGRRAHNDVVIHDIGVSGEHAAIVTSQNESVLEDLNSTNGTQVNGQPVKKHYLRNDDVIELAKYRIRYVADASSEAVNDDGGSVWSNPKYAARIKVLSGANAGREIGLVKTLTTIGQPGKHVAVVTLRPQGYCITHVEGESRLLINGQPANDNAHVLVNGDVIDVAGAKTRFLMG